MNPIRLRYLVLATLAAVVAALPAHAAAAGPPVVGGEGNDVTYSGKINGGGHIDVEVAAATDRVTHMFFQSRRVIHCQRGTNSDVGLWQTSFRLGSDRRAVKRERYGDKAGSKHALMVWDVRFAADWGTATIRVSDRFRHNTLGNCSGRFKTKVVRSVHGGGWAIGHYAGTTSQGAPLSFTAGWRRLQGLGLLEFTVTGLTATVTFPCSNGPITSTVAPGPQDLDNGALTLEPQATGGSLHTTLMPPGADDPSATVEARLNGSSATGTLDLHGQCPGGDSVDNTTITFSASRSG